MIKIILTPITFLVDITYSNILIILALFLWERKYLDKQAKSHLEITRLLWSNNKNT